MERYDVLMTVSLKELKFEEIKEIPDDSEINHTFSQDFQSKMEKLFSSVGKATVSSNTSIHSLTRKIAVFILCITTAIFSMIMLNEDVRANFYNTVTFIYEEYIKFGFHANEGSATDFNNIEEVAITYIPEGFTLVETVGVYEAKEYIYSDSVKTFSVNISMNDGLSVLTDKNESTVKKTRINGMEAYIIYAKKETEYGTVIIVGSKITTTIYGHLKENELIKIAHGIQKKVPTN